VGLPGGVVRNGSDVLDASNAKAVTSKSTEGGLGTRTRRPALNPTGGTELDVHSGNSDLLQTGDNIGGSHHGGITRGICF